MTRREKSTTVPLPFSILIDTAEQQPFTFTNILSDARHGYRPYEISTVRQCLGHHPRSFGDYSIHDIDTNEGLNGWVNIERKSVEDLQSTLLGWSDGHRERFECELDNLNRYCESSLVVVEGAFEQVIQSAPSFGKKSAQQNAKTLFRSVLSLQQKFVKVQWCFAGGRRLAEIATFHWLRKYRESWRERFPAKIDSRACAATGSPMFGCMSAPVAEVVREEIEL